jgi:hypothetical protein
MKQEDAIEAVAYGADYWVLQEGRSKAKDIETELAGRLAAYNEHGAARARINW